MDHAVDEVIVLVEWNADFPVWSDHAAAQLAPVQLHNIVQRLEETPGAFMIRALEQIEHWEASVGKLRLVRLESFAAGVGE